MHTKYCAFERKQTVSLRKVVETLIIFMKYYFIYSLSVDSFDIICSQTHTHEELIKLI